MATPPYSRCHLWRLDSHRNQVVWKSASLLSANRSHASFLAQLGPPIVRCVDRASAVGYARTASAWPGKLLSDRHDPFSWRRHLHVSNGWSISLPGPVHDRVVSLDLYLSCPPSVGVGNGCQKKHNHVSDQPAWVRRPERSILGGRGSGNTALCPGLDPPRPLGHAE
jgi:hypothetical protein